MLTGTPLDLTPFGPLLQGVGWLYWLLMLAALALALRKPRTTGAKIWATLAVVVVFGALPATALWRGHQAQGGLAQAMALFEQRCKGAGEKITRRVENVDGVVWTKWRSETSNFNKQFQLDDPFGSDCGGVRCIEALLRVTSGAEKNPEEAARRREGYRFVESRSPTSGEHLRYTGVITVIHVRTADQIEQYKKNQGVDPGPNVYGFALEQQPVPAFAARYGITWDDISTREDREHWIAGGSLKVVDLQTNEVIAERVGYMVDRGQGSEAGFRSPWLFARYTACPAFGDGRYSWPKTENVTFAHKVLQPVTGE